MTTWHPSDEDLVLQFYGDAGGDLEHRIEAHLVTCEACRASWDDLRETLALVDAARVPEPDPGFERVMWARVQPDLPSAGRPRWTLRDWLPAAAFGAVVVALVAVLPTRDLTPRAATGTLAAADARTRERVLLTALGDHFDRTQVLLVEIMNAPGDDESSREFEQATADDLVASGRLYRLTAERNGDLQLAEMLEHLETVLLEFARTAGTRAPDAVQSLRARIEDEDLIFKVRAVSSAISARQQHLMNADD